MNQPPGDPPFLKPTSEHLDDLQASLAAFRDVSPELYVVLCKTLAALRTQHRHLAYFAGLTQGVIERITELDRALTYPSDGASGHAQFEDRVIGVAVSNKNGEVFLNFSEHVPWIGFTPEEAIALARALIAHATAKENP